MEAVDSQIEGSTFKNTISNNTSNSKNNIKTTKENFNQRIDKVSEIFHFDDGTIRVFNLLGDEIRIDTIYTKDQ